MEPAFVLTASNNCLKLMLPSVLMQFFSSFIIFGAFLRVEDWPSVELVTWNHSFNFIMLPPGLLPIFEHLHNFCSFVSLGMHKVVASNYKMDPAVKLATWNHCFNLIMLPAVLRCSFYQFCNFYSFPSFAMYKVVAWKFKMNRAVKLATWKHCFNLIMLGFMLSFYQLHSFCFFISLDMHEVVAWNYKMYSTCHLEPLLQLAFVTFTTHAVALAIS